MTTTNFIRIAGRAAAALLTVAAVAAPAGAKTPKPVPAQLPSGIHWPGFPFTPPPPSGGAQNNDGASSSAGPGQTAGGQDGSSSSQTTTTTSDGTSTTTNTTDTSSQSSQEVPGWVANPTCSLTVPGKTLLVPCH
jgi:hypothetical protein